jgi:hypothetical protein
MTKRDYAETRLQQAIVQFLMQDAADGLVWWHCPNEYRASPRELGFRKSMGVVAGVPDLAFILPSGQSAFMEIKRSADKLRGKRAGILSAEQRDFLRAVEARGCLTAVVRSIDEAIRTLTAWGALKRNAEVAA